MHTISIDIEESKIDIVLNLLNHLKDGIIRNYSIKPKIDVNMEIDPFFYDRKEMVNELRDKIRAKKVPMHDFDSSMDELIKELES